MIETKLTWPLVIRPSDADLVLDQFKAPIHAAVEQVVDSNLLNVRFDAAERKHMLIVTVKLIEVL